jgi:hypothetical protein
MPAITAESARLEPDSWAAIADLARLAPTPHNTQPFRVRPLNATRAELVLVPERLLPEEDHGNLYVLSAFGIFASALERAARHLGRALSVQPIPSLDVSALTKKSPPLVLGEAHIGDACAPDASAELLRARRTSRLPYHDREVDRAALAALVAVAEEGGHRLVVESNPPVVRQLLRLNATAIIDNLQLDSEREEIRGWHRLGPTPEFGDGLWQEPMNQPAWELRTAFAAPHMFSLPGLRQFAIHRYLKTQAGTRHVGLLCGPFSRWPELLAAGRMLHALWLAMTKHEVYMQPFGSMLTNPEYAKKLVTDFRIDDCWLLFRLGYSAPPPRSPRLESILIDE